MRKVILWLTMVGALSCLLIACQSMNVHADRQKMSLPKDDRLVEGVLDNGFQYYILPNQSPTQRVYIRFVVNAGSLNEEDDQRGVAHIVEHMCFNGTSLFPENEMIATLEKAGLKFGVDVNAFTDFENTVYSLNLPRNDEATLRLAMTVIHQWAAHVTHYKSDLNAERGIILEEWRARLSPMLRLGDQKSVYELAQSRYLLRDPIGDVDTIKTVSNQRVADFYHKWYRPDNMSVVVVGDVDVQQIQSLLKETLASIPKPQTPLQTIDRTVPIIQGWRSASLFEKGITTPAVEMSFFLPTNTDQTVNRYREDLIFFVLSRLVNLRLQTWEKTHPVQSISFYHDQLGVNNSQYIFSAQLKKPDFKPMTDEVFQLLASLAKGFSEAEFRSELERLAQMNVQNQSQPSYSIDMADALMVAAASHTAYLSHESRAKLNERLLLSIELEELNAMMRQILASSSKLIVYTQISQAGHRTYTIDELKQRWQIAQEQGSSFALPRSDTKQAYPKLALKVGNVSLLRYWKDYHLYEYELGNGSRVIYHYNQNERNKVYFKALTSGGLRSIPLKDYHLLRVATTLVDETGVGGLTGDMLARFLKKSPIVLTSFIEDDKQGFSGWANRDQVETLLTLFRYKLQSSPVSQAILSAYIQDQTDLDNVFERAVARVRYPKGDSIYGLNLSMLKNFSADQLSQVYQQYMLNKTDFTYLIVGDIPPQVLEPLLAKYLAGVPYLTQDRNEYEQPAQTSDKRLLVHESLEPRAEVDLYLTYTGDWQAEKAYYLDLAGELVQDELRLWLRERSSGVYGITSWFWQLPNTHQAEGRIQFSCDPSRVDELIAKTRQVLKNMASLKQLDQQALLNKIQQRKDQLDRYYRTNLGILESLEYSYFYHGSPEYFGMQLKALNAATNEKMTSVLHDFLQGASIFEAVLLPSKAP